MPRRLFCRRFYFVSEKERKVKQSQSWPHLEPFLLWTCGEGLGDRDPKQARQLAKEKGREGAGGAILRGSPQPIIAANPKFLSAGQDEPHADLFNLHHLLQV